MYAGTVTCRTLKNKSRPKFRNHNMVKTIDGTKMSCKVISAKETNLVLGLTLGEILFFLARKKQFLKVLQKLTAKMLRVNLTPFLDLNVLCSCDRLTLDLKACLEFEKFLNPV